MDRNSPEFDEVVKELVMDHSMVVLESKFYFKFGLIFSIWAVLIWFVTNDVGATYFALGGSTALILIGVNCEAFRWKRRREMNGRN